MRSYQVLARVISIAAVSASLVISVLMPGRAEALSGADFNPGRIIDDVVFYNSNAMTVEQIQAFLNAKVPTCDTNGSKNYSYYYNSNTGEINNPNSGSWVTTSRAVYGQRLAAWAGSDWRGSQAPYACLKNRSFDTSSIAGDSLCSGYAGASGESAATVIYKVAKSCGINPQVLLVTLQKEQALITDDWPFGIQFEKAMGYRCIDDPPASWKPKNCDPEYLGFHKQVYYAARRFKHYQANPLQYNYVAGRNNQIPWHPNPNCGTSTVYIENQATAALYIYTPYRPNQAALNNLYGLGDSCSSYGVRNFWVLFNDWFGSTQGYAPLPELEGRYNQLGGPSGMMGIPLGAGFCNANRTLCWQEFKNGFIIYSPSTGAWESKGAIRAYWASIGYQNGKLGLPVGGEAHNGKGFWWQEYQHGFIVGKWETGFWESMGEIRERWGQLGFQNGVMGLPTGPEYRSSSGAIWQPYQNGYLIYSPSTGAWESKGAIREYWAKTGFQNGKLGFPNSGERYHGNGIFSQDYQYGTIIGKWETGFWESMGKLRERWQQLGAQNGVMGLPIGAEYRSPSGAIWQPYQNGFLVYTPSTGAWESKGAIRAYWASIGYQNGKAGWPTGPETYDHATKTWSQTYQKGTIYYSDTKGGWFVPN